MRIVLTGAGGQLGYDLRRALTGDEVFAFTHQELDITDPAAIQGRLGSIRPDWIINAAAYNDVDRAESDPATAFAVNGRGPANLAELAAAIGAAIVQVSTDYVFDGRKGMPYDEDDVPNPLSVYGRSKLEGEDAVMASRAQWCVVRTAWLYGVAGKNFVKAIRAAASGGKPVRVVSDQVGSPTSTADLASAISELIHSPTRGLFHVVNAGACSRFEFARAILGEGASLTPITSADAARPAPRPANAALVSRRWQRAGLTALRGWGAALDDFLRALDTAQVPNSPP